MTNKTPYRFLFAGGGTGGHLYPAIAVAQQVSLLKPEANILFVGTKSKIEGKVVPQLGYKFKSIWIKGFARKFNYENLLFPLKIFVSIIQSLIINMKFKPVLAVGSGGYVSGPAIYGASVMGAKVILLEQNSYPGVTTRMLEKRAAEIHLSYEDSKKYFRSKDKLFVTGNPVRIDLKMIDKEDALKRFNLTTERKTLLVIGGSLGASRINIVISSSLDKFVGNNIQVIWQTGKNYFDDYKHLKNEYVYINQFIEDMSAAYSACDLLIARAGATTIAEITTLGIASILIPSPNVAENHQYYNAKSLADQGAVEMIKDSELENALQEKIKKLINDDFKLEQMRTKAKSLGKPDAASIIAKRIIAYAEGKIN